MSDDYEEFIRRKGQIDNDSGFEPIWMPEFLFPFQSSLTGWSIRKGRSALLEDCGLGKSIQSLVWAQNVIEHTNKPVLISTPLAVGHQFSKEASKFGLNAEVSREGKINQKIVITNYERLGYFSPNDFSGFVADESSRLKDADSATKAIVKEFTRKIPYRLLATATAAPNDYHELGTSSEVLGELGYRDMITMFFKQEQQGGHHAWGRSKYRFREHAKKAFWRWVCSWARACRKPSDLGFSDEGFDLPPLVVEQEIIKRRNAQKGRLFDVPAVTLEEQREERRATIQERCERVAELIDPHDFGIAWCHLNDEGDLLEKMIKGCVQVSGADSDDEKERKLLGFLDGTYSKLVTKPTIACWGLNLQHCNYMAAFLSHSFEQTYQMIRRCWRYGQKRTVRCDFISTEGEERVWANYQRKAVQADEMFSQLVEFMNESNRINHEDIFPIKEELPAWL